MTDLAAFLLARVAEDEAAAKAPTPGHESWTGYPMDDIAGCSVYDGQWLLATVAWYDHDRPMSSAPGATGPGYIDSDAVARHMARWDPARVLAECEAKRRRIQKATDWIAADTSIFPHQRTLRLAAEEILSLEALPYADHPDYRPEWAP